MRRGYGRPGMGQGLAIATCDSSDKSESETLLQHSTWEDCVKKGANVNCRLDEKGFTPLMLASEGAGWWDGTFLQLEN